MNPGYWFMSAGLVSFAAMGILHKLGDRGRCNALNISLLTMGTAFLVTLLRACIEDGGVTWMASVPRSAVLLAIPFGISAAVALWLFQLGLRHGRIVTSWLIINLSTAIPTILSIVVYREPLSARKSVVLLLIVASLVLLWWDRQQHPMEGK